MEGPDLPWGCSVDTHPATEQRHARLTGLSSHQYPHQNSTPQSKGTLCSTCPSLGQAVSKPGLERSYETALSLPG